MSSTFAGLNTASTALWAQQRAVNVTGQNVANVNTEGYSRQRAELQSIGGNTEPALWSLSDKMGQGVSADKVTRIRDAFLEARAQFEHGSAATLTVENDTLAQVEQAFREPGDTGIAKKLDDMWAGWGDIANNALDPGARAQLVQRTEAVVAAIHTTGRALDQQWLQGRDTLQSLVDDVNATSSSIAALNTAIKRATQAGLPTNELADKRDLLVLKLSEKIGATASPVDDGTVNVVVGGTTVVTGDAVMKLAVAGTTDPKLAATDPPRIITLPGFPNLRPGGTALGQLNALTKIIPGYTAKLNGIAQQLAVQVNAAHQAGFDKSGAPGGPMFDDGSGSTPVTISAITAANLTLRVTDADKLAAAALSPVAGNGAISADNVNADRLYQHRLDVDGTDDTYRKMIVALGVDAAVTTGNLDTQNVISANVDTSRESVAGVNIDEEMTNMLQFQHGYAAAGRLVTAIDEMLDTLINKTGLVGR